MTAVHASSTGGLMRTPDHARSNYAFLTEAVSMVWNDCEAPTCVPCLKLARHLDMASIELDLAVAIAHPSPRGVHARLSGGGR